MSCTRSERKKIPRAGQEALLILRLYRNNLKDREFGKEGPQNLYSEDATIAERQGLSENANFEVTPTQLKTDSSCYFGISVLLNILVSTAMPLKSKQNSNSKKILSLNFIKVELDRYHGKKMLH